VMIVPAAHADGVARDIIDRFKHGLRNFYRPLDYERECIISFDRRGQRQKFGLMSLTMVSFSNAARAFSNTVELAEFAGILKHMGKQQSAAAQKSVYLKGDELEMERGPFSLLNIAQDAAIPVRFRRSAIEAMGESQEKQREDSLIELLDKDLPYLLKKSCIYALGRLRAIKAVPKLVNFVRDSNPHLRTRAVEALGNIGMVETVDMLIEALGDENIYTRRMAALALGKMGDRKAIEPLMKLLKAKDTRLRMNAVISLGELKDEGSIPLIMELMASSDTDIKKRAIWALGQMHSAAAIDKLIVMLGTEKKEMRYGIALALYEIIENAALSDVEKYTDSIVEYSYDNEPSIRKVFMSILGVLPDSPQAIKRLKECLKDRSGYVRWHATLALGRKKDKSIPPFLAGQLRDKSSQVRIAAAQRLGEIGNPDALEPLRKLLKDENMEVTQQAADAIIRILRKCGIPSQPGGPRVDL